MRQVSPELAAHLQGPQTTLVHCWRLTRRDGVVLGFTDHDAALVLAGTRFEAATGLSGSEAEEMLGLAAASREVEGALDSAAIDEADIRAGRYDAARIETFVVNWQSPEDHVLIDVAELGEVKRGETGFAAELRGVAAQLDRVRGRIYRRRCDAVFGDARCGFSASAAPYTIETTVVGGEGSRMVVDGTLGGAPTLFQNGRLTVLGGMAEGLGADIVSAMTGDEGTVTLVLAEALGVTPSPGDAVRVVQGCDKRFATCRDRFGNAVNFRGFPHMPGGDAALAIAKSDGRHDGAPVVP
ncbi:putative phage protein [Aurantimonas manganoxydans SI85-9A1]|uniref:Putative phage protein n=1 Tax=Aurantimonas manganoxydans (strain ATCC BAA-1229 / DSM 21871 / SI85-9A1) TaxID=287752 RepID=Q1YJF6_AURMS|nr:DUF2163 domain-containing protein [Aurantimonas manganoxydans]EAS50917.1 putative phage protein [Aurantimonas manganoxydans SI85-9A1]